MQPVPSEVRRRARYHVLHHPPAEMAQCLARTRRFLVIALQVATMALLAWRGFPGIRLAVHAGICVFYLVSCPSPRYPIAVRTKMRLLVCLLLSYGAWLANTGGLLSPLTPLGLGIVLPALLFFDAGRQRTVLATGATLLLVAIALLSATSFGRLLPPFAPVNGHPSLEYVAVAAASMMVMVVHVSGFWSMVTSAYTKVALELGDRREELCSMGEERVRELEGAAANLAHEMKNPLASIKALSAHLARCPTLDARTVERLEVVSAAADRLESIVDSFLSLSHGLGALRPAVMRPHGLALELKLLLDERAAQAGVTLEVTGQPTLQIRADEKKLQRALFYLTMNAVQASAPGQTVSIDVGPGRAVGAVAIRVIDRGEGMCHARLERLQKPPYSTREGGTGLGVAVARALVHQHGGQLTYESIPRRGTTATIELPPEPPATADLPLHFPSPTAVHPLRAG